MPLKPTREHATHNAQTYFVTAKTWESRALFAAEPWARLFFQNLLAHRDSYLLHEFVLMPDHFHLMLSPSVPLERAVQFVKGGFSFRVKRELGSNAEVWQRGFADHRIRDIEDYGKHVHYIHLNPVKRHLCNEPSEYRYSSVYPGWKLDPIPQGLKPGEFVEMASGTAKAVPFQNIAPNIAPTVEDRSNAVFFQNSVDTVSGKANAMPLQNNLETATRMKPQNPTS